MIGKLFHTWLLMLIPIVIYGCWENGLGKKR